MSTVARFVRSYLRHKLEAAGAKVGEKELDRLVMLVPEPPQTTDESPAVERQTLTRFSIFFRRGDITVELNANTGEPTGWLCPSLSKGQNPLTPEQALRVAREAAVEPAGAVLVQQEYQEIGGQPVFVAHWEHREDGVLVERDFIRVLVSGHSGCVFAVQRHWHTVDLEPGIR